MAGASLLDENNKPLFDIPPILSVYMFCSPWLNLEYRCLPKAGGAEDQDWVTMQWFHIIEGRIKEVMLRNKNKQNQIRTTTEPSRPQFRRARTR